MMGEFEDAARLRSAATVRRDARPRQRRAAEMPGSSPVAVVRADLGLIAPEGDGLKFHGVASVTERGYEMWDAFGPYTETVQRGAFGPSLARADLDVPLVLAHDSLRRIARTTNKTLQLAETDNGLEVDAILDPADADVAYIVPKLRSGLVDEMSFRFGITRGEWSDDFSEYRIQEVDLQRGDVAIVGYGANPYTQAQLRKAVDKVKHDRALDPEDVNALTQALGMFNAIDSIVDDALEALSAYLQVPNPDVDEDEPDAPGAPEMPADEMMSAARNVVAEVRASRHSAAWYRLMAD